MIYDDKRGEFLFIFVGDYPEDSGPQNVNETEANRDAWCIYEPPKKRITITERDYKDMWEFIIKNLNHGESFTVTQAKLKKWLFK